jgi:phosphoenolpyruvate synthase/pyruvate phosphate dikinase
MGVAEGPVRIIRDRSEFGKLRSSAVSVAPHINPAWTPLLQRAAAIVVGSVTRSHCGTGVRHSAVMGTIEGTYSLVDGERVRVGGTRGPVYRAALRTRCRSSRAEPPTSYSLWPRSFPV